MIWGSISACTASVQTYEALLGVRVLLGVSEAVFFPGAIYLLSAWYSKHELGVRIAGEIKEEGISEVLADKFRSLLFPTIR
jgi:MFS family permease